MRKTTKKTAYELHARIYRDENLNNQYKTNQKKY